MALKPHSIEDREVGSSDTLTRDRRHPLRVQVGMYDREAKDGIVLGENAVIACYRSNGLSRQCGALLGRP
jgi:hypothetical protein